MTKPVGARCNLDCSYCYYLEKERLYAGAGGHRMKPEVLETYVRDYISSQPGTAVSFAWQGGDLSIRQSLDFLERHYFPAPLGQDVDRLLQDFKFLGATDDFRNAGPIFYDVRRPTAN